PSRSRPCPSPRWTPLPQGTPSSGCWPPRSAKAGPCAKPCAGPPRRPRSPCSARAPAAPCRRKKKSPICWPAGEPGGEKRVARIARARNRRRPDIGCAPAARRALVGFVVRLNNIRGNAASVGNLHALFPGPFPDGLVALAVSRCGGRRGGLASLVLGGTLAATDAARAGHVSCQGFAEFRGVFVGQVNRVAHPVQSELHGGVRWRAVDVVDELHGDFLRHCNPRFRIRNSPLPSR